MSKIVYDERKCQFVISAPFDIGPRLWPSLKLSDDSRVSITTVGRDAEGRVHYQWAVDARGDGGRSRKIGSGVDLKSGVGSGVDLDEMFRTFADFVSAWVEAGADGDNSDIFPEAMRSWADANVDELRVAVGDEEG